MSGLREARERRLATLVRTLQQHSHLAKPATKRQDETKAETNRQNVGNDQGQKGLGALHDAAYVECRSNY